MKSSAWTAVGMALVAVQISLATPVRADDAAPKVIPGQTPLDLVNALHTAFGEHHARAVHSKGEMFEGTFTPDPAATALTKAPIFAEGTLPVVARFSLFAGVPDIPDTEGPAAPVGLALKIKAKDGTEYDLASDQHNGFIVDTSDEFATFLRAVGASGPGVAHPTPVEQFLSTRPVSRQFLASLVAPASYAQATYFGINAFKWTNAAGKSVFVRYKYVPRAGDVALKPEELKTKGPNYLQEDIVARVAKGPVVFDWYAQVAGPGDEIDKPSKAWPDTRQFVKLGTFTLTKRPDDVAAADKLTFYQVGQPHPGIEAADPMLLLRNTAYPISFGQRQ